MKRYILYLGLLFATYSYILGMENDSYAKIYITRFDEGTGTQFQIGVAESAFSRHFATHPEEPYTAAIDLKQEMMAACILGKNALIEHLHSHFAALVHAACPQHSAWNPLLYAAACGHFQTVSKLLSLEASLSTRLIIAEGSLHIDEGPAELARRQGHTQIAEVLGNLIKYSP